ELEQDNFRFRSWDTQLYPALMLIKRLVRRNAKAELLRVEGNGLVLVIDWNTGEFDATDHLVYLRRHCHGKSPSKQANYSVFCYSFSRSCCILELTNMSSLS